MSLTVINTGVFGVNSVVVKIDEKRCFVVDPAGCVLTGDDRKIVNFIQSNNLECVAIVLTHFHFDHITGIYYVKNFFPNAKVMIGEKDSEELKNSPGPLQRALVGSMGMGASSLLNELSLQPSFDVLLKENDDVFGWKVINTPGHSDGSICLYNENEGDNGTLISGDTLFAYGGYGRIDLPGGSASDMKNSIEKLKKIVKEDTKLYPGHDAYDIPFHKDNYIF